MRDVKDGHPEPDGNAARIDDGHLHSGSPAGIAPSDRFPYRLGQQVERNILLLLLRLLYMFRGIKARYQILGAL